MIVFLVLILIFLTLYLVLVYKWGKKRTAQLSHIETEDKKLKAVEMSEAPKDTLLDHTN